MAGCFVVQYLHALPPCMPCPALPCPWRPLVARCVCGVRPAVCGLRLAPRAPPPQPDPLSRCEIHLPPRPLYPHYPLYPSLTPLNFLLGAAAPATPAAPGPRPRLPPVVPFAPRPTLPLSFPSVVQPAFGLAPRCAHRRLLSLLTDLRFPRPHREPTYPLPQSCRGSSQRVRPLQWNVILS